MCVSDLVQDTPITSDLVEWIELHRLFGLEEMTTYTSPTSNLSASLSHYVDEEFLKVHRISPVFDYSENRTLENITKGLLLYDCLYRNTYRYKYIFLGIVGRIFVPREASSYSQLLQYTNEHLGIVNSAATYSFNGANFLIRPDLADSQQPPYLKSLTYRRRLPVSTKPSHCGLLVNARLCLKISGLKCAEVVGGSDTVEALRYVDANIDPQKGLLHRYVQCSDPEEKCRRFRMEEITEDDTLMEVHKDILRMVRQGRVLNS